MTTRNREFNDWIQQLEEHETYCLYNGDPVVNGGSFKVCPNELKLVFNGGTTVSKMALPEIPTHQFQFKPIADFLTGKFSNDLLYGELLFDLYVSFVIPCFMLFPFSRKHM